MRGGLVRFDEFLRGEVMGRCFLHFESGEECCDPLWGRGAWGGVVPGGITPASFDPERTSDLADR